MSQRRIGLSGFLILGLILVAGAGWWWFGSWRFPQFKVVLRGSSSNSEKLSISGGNLAVVAPEPGVFFGTVRTPGGPERFTYIVLFRYGRPRADGVGHGLQFHSTSDGRSAETTDAIELGGKRIEAAYRVELNETLTAVAEERLTLGGKPVDLASGRVFLIDLASDSPVYRQKKAEPPAIQARIETTEDVERMVGSIRKGLGSQDPEIEEFLR